MEELKLKEEVEREGEEGDWTAQGKAERKWRQEINHIV